jgi:rhamnosyltransferase
MNSFCCVVIVSYNPSQRIVENIVSLAPQVGEILIVDNNSNNESIHILKNLSKEIPVSIIYNQSNLGIATALNQGVKYASDHDYEWLATFDQDSLAPINYVQTMMDSYYSCNDRENVALIAPRYQTDIGLISFSLEQNYKEKNDSNIKTTMTSGNLVKLSIFPKTGLFDDSFFIDYVDHEFCLRVRSSGWSIIESHQSILIHSLGNSTSHKIGNITITTTGHAPVRRYYKYRNLVRTIKKYYWFDPWLLKDLKALMFEPLKIILFEEKKLLKLGCIYKGVFDGIIGK